MITHFTITGDIPSKKNNRRHVFHNGRPYSIPGKFHQDWEELHLRELAVSGIEPLLPPYKVTMVIYPKTKRKADLTNKVESINDLLVKAGILQDDNWFVLPEVTLKLGKVDKKNPRAEITILSADTAQQVDLTNKLESVGDILTSAGIL